MEEKSSFVYNAVKGKAGVVHKNMMNSNRNLRRRKRDCDPRNHGRKVSSSAHNCPRLDNSSPRNSAQSRHETTGNSSIEAPFATLQTQDRLKLSSWGLPATILGRYESRGVTNMFPWQVECLSNRELLQSHGNIVYSAPTSAGKTLVAEILLMKTLLERRKKVIFILPFVSVVREKMYYFQDLLVASGLRVEGFMGGCAPAGGFAATDMAIATIEKANSLVNQLMEEGTLSSVGAVVVDELHLLGDPHRGYLLELLLTKLKYMNEREEGVEIQIIGMSATLPNLALLAKWLNASLYRTDFRPVPLEERCKIGKKICDTRLNDYRILPSVPELSNDSDDILQLCAETISDGHSVLIFCPTKNWCETLSQQIATAFCQLGRENKSPIGRSLREQLNTDAIMETLEQLKRSPAGLDRVLKGTVCFGSAFHHAGLTMDERDIIEGAFRSGALRVLTATSTLSSGVNLPARRVIIRSLMFHGKPLDTLTYRQMIGRAGRMGKDTAGESILVCKPNETRAAKNLLTSNLPPLASCLEGSEPLIRALLEVIASEVAYTAADIDKYTKCTLAASMSSDGLIEEATREAIGFLTNNELLMLQTSANGDEDRWIATALGKGCLAASIPPCDALFLFDQLQKARRCFVLDTELHVIYLVTPINSSSQIGEINWLLFLDLWTNISESERRVGQLVGVEEAFVMSAIQGSTRAGKLLDIHKRFYTALALHELVREVPLLEVCRKYGCCRGLVQSLQQSASTFAGMVTQFCKKLGWSCMELLIGQFQARLQFGVCRELLDLLRIPMLNGLRARSLYKEGITTVAELALANVLDVERALHNALPFESEKEQLGEHEFEAVRRKNVRSVFITGKDGLTTQEAAALLMEQARTLVQNELGIGDVQWKRRENTTGISQDSTEERTDQVIQSEPGALHQPENQRNVDSTDGLSIREENRTISNGEIQRSTQNDPGITTQQSTNSQQVCYSNNASHNEAKSTRISIPNRAIGSPTCEAICVVGTLDFSNFRNETDPKRVSAGCVSTNVQAVEKHIATETPTCEGIDVRGTFDFSNFRNETDPKGVSARTVKAIATESPDCQHVSVGGSFAFSSFGNNTNARDDQVSESIKNSKEKEKDVAIESPRQENMIKEKLVHEMEIGNRKRTVEGSAIPKRVSKAVDALHTEAKSTGISIPNQVMESRTCEELCVGGTFDFTSFRNETDSKEVSAGCVSKNIKAIDKHIATESPTYQRVSVGGSLDFSSFVIETDGKDDVPESRKNAKDNEKDIAIESPTQENIIAENFVHPMEIGNRKRRIKGSTIRKVVSKAVASFSPSGTDADANIPMKTVQDQENIFDFPNISNLSDMEIANDSSKTHGQISKKSKTPFQPDEVNIGSRTLAEICNDDIIVLAEFANGKKSATGGEKNLIGRKSLEAICDDVFELSDAAEAKGHVESKSQGDRGNVFEFKGVESPNNPIEGPISGRKRKSKSLEGASRVRESFREVPSSRTPSLFGDSFSFDSQDFNILEQNIIDPLDFSSFGDTSIFVESKKNTPENHVFAKENRQSNSAGSRGKLSRRNSTGWRRSPRISALRNLSSLVWEDNSWDRNNDVNGEISSPEIFPQSTSRQNLRSWKSPIGIENCEKSDLPGPAQRPTATDRLLPKVRATELQRMPQQRRISSPGLAISPSGSLLKFTGERKLSVDLCESDASDDFVVASQSVSSVATGGMSKQARIGLESLRESRNQRITKSRQTVEKPETSPDVLCDRCSSIGSVVSNSDEEILPLKRANVLSKKKLEKKRPSVIVSLPRNKLLSSIITHGDKTRMQKRRSCPNDIKIVRVSTTWAKFNKFKRDLNDKKDLSMALACENFHSGTCSIGTKIIGIAGIDDKTKTKKNENYGFGNKRIHGVAVSWDGVIAHYISFDNTHESKVPVKDRLDCIKELLNSQDVSIRCFSFKDTYKILFNCCRIASTCKFLDPKVAAWLLEPESSKQSFYALIVEHFTEAEFLLKRAVPDIGSCGPGLNVKSAISCETRASTEAALNWHLTNILMEKLESRSSTLVKTFKEIEMGTLELLARMELTGLGVHLESLLQLSEVMERETSRLQKEAYSVAGRKFNCFSSKDVAQVLGLYKGKKISTNKAVLERCENPLSRLILSYRKLNTIQVKTLYPLLRLAECNSRIYGNCITNTVTGRVSMCEPNLQNIPRDFNSPDDAFVISVRKVFVPVQGNVMISADYCQLELRILAHFSKETNLCNIFRKECDVFKNIASRWYNLSQEKIDDTMRQRTKQLCYGLIYGIGVKSLAESLSTTETEAKEFMDTFMATYPGIRPWLSKIVEKARVDGYVTTLMHRRRYLAALNSSVPSERSQAERQAVNTKIQGSAADITKKAMIDIDQKIRMQFPDAPLVLPNIAMKRKLRRCNFEALPRGGYLVLQIHDELLYEVNIADAEAVGNIIKETMEKSCELRVPLPVKLKIGSSWGDLKEHA